VLLFEFTSWKSTFYQQQTLPTMSEETKTTTAVASSEVKANETAPPEPEKEPTDKKKVRENHPRVSPHAGQPGQTARILFSCPKHHFPVRTCHGTCHVPQCLRSSYPGRRGGASRRQAGEFRDWHCRPGGFLVHPRDFHLASLTLLLCFQKDEVTTEDVEEATTEKKVSSGSIAIFGRCPFLVST